MDSPPPPGSKDLSGLVLHRDGLILVLDKPAGIAVHQGPPGKGGDFLEAHFDSLRFGLPRPPALAHRLDRDTSGCLVLGRHRKALQRLGTLFKSGRVGKTYWAVVEGAPSAETGTIDLPLATLEPGRGWWMKVDPAGLPSRTHYRVLGRDRGRTWLELTPMTGRTHQLRVHCAASGWPIVGDYVYGGAKGPERLHLHARRVVIPLQPTKPPVTVEAPLPSHMQPAMAGYPVDAATVAIDAATSAVNAATEP